MADAPKEDVKADQKSPEKGTEADSHATPAKPSKIKLVLAGIVPKLKALKPNFKGGGAGVKTSVSHFFKNLATLPLVIVRGDSSSRIIFVGFVVSFVVVLLTGGELVRRFAPTPKFTISKSDPSHEGSEMSEFFKNQKELSMASDSMLYLERFSASLNANVPRVNSFEIEIWLECDKPDTARALKARMPLVREVIANAMQEQSYEKLLTDKGKEALQLKMGNAINRLLEKIGVEGSVKRVLFSQFMMG